MDGLPNLDFRSLRIFLTLMTERSVTKTAMLLGVSQPAVTQCLNKLRQAFRDPLLVRGPQHMVPTARAMRLEGEVRRFLQLIDDTHVSEAFDLASEERNIIVTAPEYLELLLLPKIASALRREAPRITLSIRAPDARKATDLLATGEVDFRMGWVRDPPLATRAMPLFQDEIVVIAGVNNSMVGDSLTLEQYVSLAHIRLFGTGLTTSGRVIDDYMKQHGRTLPVCIFAQGLLALLESLHQTDVVATIPKRMAEEISKTFAIKIVPFPGVLPTVRNALYWHEKNHRSPLHHWFRTLVVDVAAELRTPRKESGR